MKLEEYKASHPNQWPSAYLLVREERSGEEWIRPIRGNGLLDLKRNILKWIKDEFNGELVLDPPIQPRLSGDYWAAVITDHRPPDSVVVWQSGGFWLKQW